MTVAATAPTAVPTPLARRLAAQIVATGPISVAEYMAACLGDPEHGYYMRRDPFGAAGDFVTAPEISQIFGELIGLWSVATWEAMGSPRRFLLTELGPGRGTLMMDALRAARIRPAFVAAAEVSLVETSPHLRAVQASTLADSGSTPRWYDHFDDLPVGPAIVIANEFFDALPVRQLIRTDGGWAERMVGINADGQLAFGLREAPSPPGGAPSGTGPSGMPSPGGKASPMTDSPPTPLPVGAMLELRPAADAIMAAIAARLASQDGAALIIDYGHGESGFGDTLQALYRHAYDDPLAHPGETDLTAHVDFAALARSASAVGTAPTATIGQGDFLFRLGIAERARRLAIGKDTSEVAAIEAAVQRLAGAEAMGTLFKVMGVATPGLALPAF